MGRNLNFTYVQDSYTFWLVKTSDMGLGVVYGYAKVAQKIWGSSLIMKLEKLTNIYTKVNRNGQYRPKFELRLQDSYPFEFVKIFDMGLGVAYGYAKVAQKIWGPSPIRKLEKITHIQTKVIQKCPNLNFDYWTAMPVSLSKSSIWASGQPMGMPRLHKKFWVPATTLRSKSSRLCITRSLKQAKITLLLYGSPAYLWSPSLDIPCGEPYWYLKSPRQI